MNLAREKQVRVFLAIKLSGRIIQTLAELKKKLVDSGIHTQWVRPENIHLTIRFLGDIPARSIVPIRSCLTAAADGIHPMRLAVQGMGVFPGVKRARVIWAGIGGEIDRLEVLHRRLGRELEKLGFAPEARRFAPHLTLGRIKKPIPPAILAGAIEDFGMFSSLSFTARMVYVIKSGLTKNGPVYTDLGSVTLESPMPGDSLEV